MQWYQCNLNLVIRIPAACFNYCYSIPLNRVHQAIVLLPSEIIARKCVFYRVFYENKLWNAYVSVKSLPSSVKYTAILDISKTDDAALIERSYFFLILLHYGTVLAWNILLQQSVLNLKPFYPSLGEGPKLPQLLVRSKGS